MHGLTTWSIFMALLTINVAALNVKLDCGEPGCFQKLSDKVASLSSSLRRPTDPTMPALPRVESKAKSEDLSSLPPVCRPSSFKNYRSFVDRRRFEKRSLRSDSKTQCCMTCQDVGDCFSFEYNMAKSLCNYYVSMGKVAQIASKSQSNVCPSGLGEGYMELPNYPLWPGHHGHEYGPCLSGAAAGKGPDLGLDLQAVSDHFNQQILDLPKEDLGLEDDEDEDEVYELR